MSSEEKSGPSRDQIPQGIRNLDQTGYLWVPRVQLLPFLRKVDEVFRKHINESSFQIHGEGLFKLSSCKCVSAGMNCSQFFSQPWTSPKVMTLPSQFMWIFGKKWLT